MEQVLFFATWVGPAISLIAKLALVKGKRIGWILQISAAFCWAVIAFSSSMMVWFVLEIWAIGLLLYSFLEWGKNEQNDFDFFKKVLTGISTILMVVFFANNTTVGAFFEWVASGSFMFGTILLSNKKESYQRNGWRLYAIGFSFLAVAMFLKGLIVLAILQIFSLGIAIWRNKKNQ